MADTLALGASAARREGSSPSLDTTPAARQRRAKGACISSFSLSQFVGSCARAQLLLKMMVYLSHLGL